MVKKDLGYYMNLPYTITLKRRSGEGEEYWVARVLELPHCMTHAATPEEAARDIEDAKREWLKSNLEDSLPIPVPKNFTGQFHLRMSHSLHESLTRMAEMEDVSLNQYIALALSHAVGRDEVIKGKIVDVKDIMKDAGLAWMSIGKGSGQNRAIDAAKAALASPLLNVSIEGAKGVLFNIVGSSNLTLFEVNQATEVIRAAVDPDANVIFFISNEAVSENEVTITLFATGFQAKMGMDSRNAEEEHMTTMLKNMKTENELDMPKTWVRKV